MTRLLLRVLCRAPHRVAELPQNALERALRGEKQRPPSTVLPVAGRAEHFGKSKKQLQAYLAATT